MFKMRHVSAPSEYVQMLTISCEYASTISECIKIQAPERGSLEGRSNGAEWLMSRPQTTTSIHKQCMFTREEASKPTLMPGAEWFGGVSRRLDIANAATSVNWSQVLVSCSKRRMMSEAVVLRATLSG